MLSDVTSGHDIELVVGSGFVENLFQLMLDTGSIATNVTLGALTATVKANEAIRRTYSAFPGTDYTVTTPSNFSLTARDMGSYDPEHVYFSVTLVVDVSGSEMTVDLWFKLRKEIDLAEEIGLIRDYIDEVPDETGAPSSYDILDLVELVGILGTSAIFDASDVASNIPSVYQPLADQINGYLTAFQTELKDGLHEDITDFFDTQTDPLNMGSIESIAFKGFPDTNRLGVYVNLKLLDHDSGWVGSRGDLDDAQDFVPLGADFARRQTRPGHWRIHWRPEVFHRLRAGVADAGAKRFVETAAANGFTFSGAVPCACPAGQ